MKRLLAVVLATAAAAAVAAAITIPAGADSGSGSDSDATFVNCLRTNGVDIPADTRGVAIKQWFFAHESPSVEDAIQKCAPDAKKRAGNGEIEVQKLITCLKDHGLQPPAAPDQLKDWMGNQSKDTLKACGVEIGKTDRGGAELADCLRKNGAAVPAGADGMTLKNWIRDHAGEPAVANAMSKCEMAKPGECAGPAGGPRKPGDDGNAPAPAPKPEATDTPGLTLQQ
jgi:hypothetical protein